ncbi:1401_t:CDS:1, partial [Paraglomus brasilianum]
TFAYHVIIALPIKAKWIDYDPNYTYPLEIYFPNVDLHIREDRLSLKVFNKRRCPNKKQADPQLHQKMWKHWAPKPSQTNEKFPREFKLTQPLLAMEQFE